MTTLFQWHIILNFLDRGGPVMIPLLFISILMWILILERSLFYRKTAAKTAPAKSVPNKKEPASLKSPGQRDPEELLTVHGKNNRHENQTDAALENSLEQHLSLIGVLAKCAPLLGLMGTVLGMIRTFDTIAVFGTGNPRAMAAGISEALITTQTGLLIAIPGLCMHNFLSRRMENLKNRILLSGMQMKRKRNTEAPGYANL